METRARARHRASALPHELWQLILSFLEPCGAIQAALVCSDFAAIVPTAAEQACRRLWPQHAHRLTRCGEVSLQKFLRLVQAHENEVSAHPDVAKAKQVQKMVCPEHRQIAVEWLIEVSWDWQLESTVVYRGAQYLDHYLAAHAVPALSKFQMLAISCLRTALKHSSKLAERERQRLPCKHWAEVTDGACTEAEVRNTCTKLDRMLHQHQRSHPNAKQRLRFLWYRLYDAGAVRQEHVYVYMLSSFLLHLSLLDSQLSAVTPTKLATAAISFALKVFGFPQMPRALQEHCFYLMSELQQVHKQLQRVQTELPAQQLRALWVQSYSYIGTNPDQQPAYSHLQRIVAAPGKLECMPGVSSSDGMEVDCTGSVADVVTAAAPAAAAAAASAGSGFSTAADAAAVGPAPPGHAAAAASGTAAAVAASAPVLNRVLTRAAAAAASVQSVCAAAGTAAAAAAGGGVPTAIAAHGNSSMASSSYAGTNRATGAAAPGQPEQQDLTQEATVSTPRHPALSAFAGGTIDPNSFLAAASSDALTATQAAAGMGSSSGQQAAAGGVSSARRCATRELPARKAVTTSRYGMLTCRGGAAGTATAGPSSSHAVGAAGAGTSGVVRSHAAAGAGSSKSDGPSSSLALSAEAAALHMAAGAGPSWAAAAAGPSFAGSMTPASPKHAPAGSRGLAALFAGARNNWANTNNAGSNSSSRLLDGLPLMHTKLGTPDADLEQQLKLQEDPLQQLPLMLAFRQHDMLGQRHQGGHASGLLQPSAPVLRSTRRSAAAAAAAVAAAAAGGGFGDLTAKTIDRPGMHTRSHSG